MTVRPVLGLVCAALMALLLPATAGAAAGSFELVGHSPLLARGMNSALAVHGDYAYVGSRTDGTHPNAGVMVVDISDPADPQAVNQIGPPAAGNPGESSRELRVWRGQGLLLVMSFECDPVGHVCAGALANPPPPTIRFFDIRGANAADPRLVATYRLPLLPHEFFLWRDPRDPGRALLYISTPDPEGGPQLLVTDISGARDGRFRELARFRAPIPAAGADGEVALHSLSVSGDGRRAYLAYLGGGFLVADTSQLAAGRPDPQVRLVTPVENRVRWPGPGAHSAVPLFGSPFALTTDEVYGEAFGLREVIGFDVLRGCPWGWVRLIDIADPEEPRVAAQHRVNPYNSAAYCERVPPLRNEGASYSSHNPTLARDIALVTWHSAGLQAISLADPREPRMLAEFVPRPLPAVVTEDPALSSTPGDKVVMWSYPVVQDGLIYVADIRNGLYVLRYRGPHADRIRCLEFLEGNSNLGWPPAC